MFKSRNLFMSMLAVLLALTLSPLSAMAISENELESAPEVSLPEDDIPAADAETTEDSNQDDYTYRPEPVELPQRGTQKESQELNLPRLTDAELSQVRELMAAREAGEQPDFTDRHYASPEKVFEAGVYPLDPEAFGGNTFYVILPYAQMNRDQLLSLLSAFDELGIPFDPDSLNNTNCVRGTSLLYNPATRSLSREEQTRFNEIQELLRHDIFDRDTFTAADTCMTVQVRLPGYESLAYEYLEPFSFYPYRAMTDNELATFAIAQENIWEIHPDRLEKKARQYAHKVFPLPLSMTASDETRYAYSEDYIEFRNTFTIDAGNCGGIYASPDETPLEVMVEQNLYSVSGSDSADTVLGRILIDYPALYSGPAGGQSVCSDEELKAAARQWAERYLLVPEEDILSDWVFDMRSDDWGSVQYRLLTSEWLVTLELSENSAKYMQACIYNRDCAVEYDDWNQDASGETATEEAAGTDESAWGTDRDTVDKNARQELNSLLNLPSDMITESISRLNNGYVQYRSDYSFTAGDSEGESVPSDMIVYQVPYITKTSELRVESAFLSYPSVSGGSVRLSDEEYVAAARKWAEKTLLIPAEDILEDWTYDSQGSEGTLTVVYQLQTREWTVYLQMHYSGDYCWSGFYHLNTP